VRGLPLNRWDAFGRLGRPGVSFSNYNAFLTAYLSGEVSRLVVVDHLANAPGPEPVSQWFADTIKDLLGRS
jgi:hypothetical protein